MLRNNFWFIVLILLLLIAVQTGLNPLLQAAVTISAIMIVISSSIKLRRILKNGSK